MKPDASDARGDGVAGGAVRSESVRRALRVVDVFRLRRAGLTDRV